MKNVFPQKKSESREILAEKADPGGETPYGTEETPKLPIAGAGWRAWWPVPRRYYVSLMAFFGFANIYAMRVNLSIAILKMMENKQFNLTNGTTVYKRGEFYHWDSTDEGLILGAFFYGYILTQIPGGWLAGRTGGKTLFGLGVLSTSLLTLLTPPLAHLGGKGMLWVVRFTEGLFEGVTYPAIHALWRHWAPPLEKTKLASFAFAGAYFGTVVAMPIAAALAANWDWPSIFYVFGLVALLWCTVWFKTIKETPAEDPKVAKEELVYVQHAVGFSLEQVKNLNPPWKAMLMSPAVWGIVAGHLTENWGFYTMLTYLPTYMNDVLKFELSKTGIYSALPYLVMGILLVVGGLVSDYLRDKKRWDTGFVRKLFCCSGLLIQAFFILITAHMPTTAGAVAGITLGIGLGGFVWAGFSVNPLDIAPQYAGVVMGLSNTFATIPGIVGPSVVGAIVTDKQAWQWRIVFYIVSAMFALGAAVYYVAASGDVQPWAHIQGGYASQLTEIDRPTDTENKEQTAAD